MTKRLILVLLAILLVACGGRDEPTAVPPTNTPEPTNTPPPTNTPEPTSTPEPTATPAPTVSPNEVRSLDDVRRAVVRIEFQGTFVDPQVGTLANASGGGSGFIINEEGIAITNNHVVTGAALLRVYVDGETRPRNARILGVSECSDLAVIDIDGRGFSYLTWYPDPPRPGLDVYAAGYPLGDPEFTLTRGIVSKANADGESYWASVDNVLEHDATINPGNSGGPLITSSGQVVGVNYAGVSSTKQYYAIKRAEALEVIEELQAERDVTSIGVNGTAVNDGAGLSGIWVSSVKSGSPADRAGVKPGDIITAIEGLFLATDGTMSDYCDILRTHRATDVLRIRVLRYETEELLEGQLNGDKLAVIASFAQTLGGEVSGGGGSGGGATYSSYTTVTDESGRLSVEIPREWNDIIGSPWKVDDVGVGAAIRAAADLDAFYDTWNTPGLFFGASAEPSMMGRPDDLLDAVDLSDLCDYDRRIDYEDALYVGSYDLWTGCDGEDMLFINLVVEPADQSFIINVQVVVVSDADLDALDHILASFIADL